MILPTEVEVESLPQASNMALLDLKAEVESLPRGCNMISKRRLNPCPSALSMMGVGHGFPEFCSDIGMVGHAPPSFFNWFRWWEMGCLPVVFTFLWGMVPLLISSEFL